MNEYEYEHADDELIAMVNGKTPTDGKTVGVVVSAERMRELEDIEAAVRRIRKSAPIAESTAAAAVFFAAAVLGWMDLTFGTIVTLITAGRAVWLFWRTRHGCRRAGK